MHEMNAFERQLSSVVRGAAPPPSPVDVSTIVRDATTTSPKRRIKTMFSATKFVVAGAIVALFGGFVLAGVLTMQPSEEQASVVGASASPSVVDPSPPSVDAAERIVWTRWPIPGADASAWPSVWSDGSYLVTTASRGTLVSPDGLDWLEVGAEVQEVISAYDGTIAMIDDGSVRTLRADGAGDPETIALPDSFALPDGFASWTSGAIGPRGMVLVECDGGCDTSTVWHTADGLAWEQVYRETGVLWEWVIASPDGFAARTDHGGDFSVMHSPDGHAWERINEEGFDRFQAIGTAPFGMVLEEPHAFEEGYPRGEGGLVLAGADGLQRLDLPPDIEAQRSSRAPQVWGAGGLGLAGLFLEDRSVAFTSDGKTWRHERLPDELPYLSTGWWRPVLHVADGVLLLQVPFCQDPAIDEDDPDNQVDCTRDGDDYVGTLWYRGVLPRQAPQAFRDDTLEMATEAVARTDSALLPGVDLVTTEVAPGVYRLLSDDAGHDLVAEPPADITVAPDGSIWLLRASGDRSRGPWDIQVDAVYQLGHQGTHPFEPAAPSTEWGSAFALDGDGMAWVSLGADVDEGTLASFDGSTWSAPTWPDGSTAVTGIESTEDGAVWLSQRVQDGAGPRVARVENGDWHLLPNPDDPALAGFFHGYDRYFAPSADGSAWLANGNFHGQEPGPIGLLHFDGERWASVELPGDGRFKRAGLLALGPDGSLWVYLAEGGTPTGSGRPWALARHDAGGWTIFTRDDGVPQLIQWQGSEASMAVDGQGRVWIAPMGDGYFETSVDPNSGGYYGDPNELVPPLGPPDVPHGVITFDGSTWNQFLRGLKVNRIDVAPDGNVYATVLYGCPDGCGDEHVDIDWSMAGLYVITPEAMAGTG